MVGPSDALSRTGLQVDFYLLVLAAVYHADGLWGDATFDLTLRALPEGAGYAVAAGVHEAVEAVRSMRFSEEDIAWLRQQKAFADASPGFWSALEYFEFQGDIDAVAEGTLVFPDEPILRVTAPLLQATLAQTLLLQKVGHATMTATRAARFVELAGGRRVYEFGSRRMPGPASALLAARAAFVGGCYATSNALAAAELDIPAMGTLSSGFFAAYGDDDRALEAFSIHFPSVGFVNLPDGSAFEAVRKLKAYQELIRIVRVDSSSLESEARKVRQALNRTGMSEVLILGSGSLDEDAIARLDRNKAPVDLIGVGKSLVRGLDGTGFSYRLSEIWRGHEPEPALHAGASKIPGRKQLVRFDDHDVLAKVDEEHEQMALGGKPLLKPVVEGGQRLSDVPHPSVGAELCAKGLARLPEGVRAWPATETWPVRLTGRLSALSLG
ncbi:MAG: hypothetical protein GY913_05940 [Proteobacteria bacterium]|nr:hypothetical protein [Pseudomonadota bacterium]MCP4916446.1 hypothetical protein [Pseudomonadota bacterium]